MKHAIVGIRNMLLRGTYKSVLKPIFFMNDPELVHDRMVRVGAVLGNRATGKTIAKTLFGYAHPMLRQTVLGISFANPIGLAAGFDKNAELGDILPSVGFGFVEFGSITGYPCEGNPKPRLWRLKKSMGLLVYYGLKNAGSEAISKKLAAKKLAFPYGTSIAMTNCEANTCTKTAIADYAKAFKECADIGDYFTINISCPNTRGGQPFVLPHKLDYLLDIIDPMPTKKPIFVKLSPDISCEHVEELLAVIKRHRVHGIICTNLTKNRDNKNLKDKDVPVVGGMSGKLVQEQSDKLLAYIYTKTRGSLVLIGCGGVFNAEDAYKKIKLGASLVQLATGMIYEGPQVISEINRGLVTLLKRDGFKNISEAIGADNA